MWMDADDVLPESSLRLLAEKKERMDPKTDVIMLPYQTAFDEAGNPVFIYERERIVRNCPRSVWIGPVHEVIVPFGNILHLEAPIRHEKNDPGESGRNLRIYEGQLAKGWKPDARQQYYYGRELYFHERYEEAEKVFQRFLKNPDAWIVNRVDALRLLAGCRYRQGREEEALEALLHALTLDRPRAEICCDLGKHFLDRGRYEAAVFWYQAALSLPERTDEGGFVERDCCGFLPCIQLCICFDRLGDRRQAEEYNERAADIARSRHIICRIDVILDMRNEKGTGMDQMEEKKNPDWMEQQKEQKRQAEQNGRPPCCCISPDTAGGGRNRFPRTAVPGPHRPCRTRWRDWHNRSHRACRCYRSDRKHRRDRPDRNRPAPPDRLGRFI